jgi:hypothetical protein
MRQKKDEEGEANGAGGEDWHSGMDAAEAARSTLSGERDASGAVRAWIELC